MARIGASTIGLFGSLSAALAFNAGAAGIPDADWPAYNNTVNGQRYAELDRINVSNVDRLKEVCRLKIDDAGTFQAGLVALDGTLYFTNAHDTLAVDARTCAVRWRHHYQAQQAEVFQINRGVAYANGKVFRGTPDARLLAIDAVTGKTLWLHQAGDPVQGEFFSSVPAAWQGTIILGTAGGDWGIRGRVMAFDQNDGRELWRFYTIPRGKEVGAETWKNAGSARYGGGGSWTTYTLDMASGEVFVPVGNPAPDFVPSHRPGENLFTNSLVVLDARTGALKWWHQMESNDGLDLDLGAAPALYWDSKGEAMVAFGSKDGHLYAVNRETRKRAFKTAITTVKKPGTAPTREGVYTCPGPLGGVEWNGPAYDAKTRQLVVGAVDWCAHIKSEEVAYQPGKFMVAGGWQMDEQRSGWISAVDPDTGKLRWQYHASGPVVAGLTPTAGGITFAGDLDGNLLALDSATGELRFKQSAGGALAGGIITYATGGTQYVAVTAGNVSRASFGDGGQPTLVVYALAEDVTGAPAAATPAANAGLAKSAGAPDPAHGKALFAQSCAGCHGAQGEGGVGPTLVGLSKKLDLAATVNWIKNPSAKMPRLYPGSLGEQDVADIAAYLQKF